jgi:coenzyme PQQ synthesis protein D (PqqD)
MKRAALLPRSRTDNLVIRELDDETLVYDTERDQAHCLNQTAALVWAQCDGKTTAVQAAHSLKAKLDASVDTDLVWLAVKQLERFHLVETNGTSPSVSRRHLVLKYAPAALALPVIMSISAPTPAGTSSCIPCVYNFDCPTGQGLTCFQGCCIAA